MNYRQVILTPVPGKVIEQLSVENISKLVKDKVTGSNQHGFMKGQSCLINLMIAF